MAVPFSGDTPGPRNTCLPSWPVSLAELPDHGHRQWPPGARSYLGDSVRCGAAFLEAWGPPLQASVRPAQTPATLATCLLVSRGHSSSALGPHSMSTHSKPEQMFDEFLNGFLSGAHRRDEAI